VRIERRGLVDLGQREPHLFGEGHQVGGAELTVGVLDQVQVLDEQIPPAGPVAEQGGDLGSGVEVDLTALLGWTRAAATLAGVLEPPDLRLHATEVRRAGHRPLCAGRPPALGSDEGRF
jgi:hypothetical protein